MQIQANETLKRSWSCVGQSSEFLERSKGCVQAGRQDSYLTLSGDVWPDGSATRDGRRVRVVSIGCGMAGREQFAPSATAAPTTKTTCSGRELVQN